MSTNTNTSETMSRRTHPQFPGPIGNPKAGKRARMSFRGGWHHIEHHADLATKALVNNPHK